MSMAIIDPAGGSDWHEHKSGLFVRDDQRVSRSWMDNLLYGYGDRNDSEYNGRWSERHPREQRVPKWHGGGAIDVESRVVEERKELPS